MKEQLRNLANIGHHLASCMLEVCPNYTNSGSTSLNVGHWFRRNRHRTPSPKSLAKDNVVATPKRRE
jgi:hypothetical protein